MSRRTRCVVAPGKVVLLGEYAVLDGVPSVVAAVPSGVAVQVKPRGAYTVLTPTGDDRFVTAAIRRVLAHTQREELYGSWTFTNHRPPATASKPGLGGSAAATVAATFAARLIEGLPTTPNAVFADALATHQAVQGSGSGVDVAASTWGGVSRFTVGKLPVAMAPLQVSVWWTGASAKTGPRVQAYRAWASADPAAHAAFVSASAEAVAQCETDPVAAFEANRRALEAMADAAGLAYRTPALDALATLAADHGGAAKASGAGGGDCGVAVFADAGAGADFADAAQKAGYVPVAAQTAQGVQEVPEAP